MIHLNVARFVAPYLPAQEQERLRRAAVATLAYANADPHSELTLVLTSDKEIQQLNRQVRQTDSPTDVLSFAAQQTPPSMDALYLGDVIISFERARANVEDGSSEYKLASVYDELILLVVHGVLHLLGHDHADLAEKERMWQTQRAILTSLGISFQDI